MGTLNCVLFKVIFAAADLFYGAVRQNDFSNGVAGGIPVIIDVEAKNTVDSLSEQCITFSREDWDAYETSWDFKRNPLV